MEEEMKRIFDSTMKRLRSVVEKDVEIDEDLVNLVGENIIYLTNKAYELGFENGKKTIK